MQGLLNPSRNRRIPGLDCPVPFRTPDANAAVSACPGAMDRDLSARGPPDPLVERRFQPGHGDEWIGASMRLGHCLPSGFRFGPRRVTGLVVRSPGIWPRTLPGRGGLSAMPDTQGSPHWFQTHRPLLRRPGHRKRYWRWTTAISCYPEATMCLTEAIQTLWPHHRL